MKRTITTIILATISWAAMAQRLDITLTSGSVVSYDISKIDCMEILPEAEPGKVSGNWYLGYRVMSSSSVHYDGTEKLTFNNDKLIWKTSTKETVYDLTYAENKKSFKAIPEGNSTGSTYNILAYEDELLVLKTGSIMRYFYKSPEDAHNAEMVSFPNRTEYTDTAKVWAQKGGSSHSDANPMGSHFVKFPAATQEQIEWLLTASNQPDASFINVSGYDRWTSKTINLYPFGSPMPADVNQHAIGNCCMCAVLASFAYIYPGFIESIITKKTSTTYIVKMFDPKGNPIEVAVDNKLLCNSSGGCAQLSGKNGVFTWATILEKALMKWETCFRCNGIGGIGTEFAAPPFTGCGDSWSFSPGKLFSDEMSIVVDYALKNGMISVGGFNKGDLLCGTLNTVTGHAFTVMYTTKPDDYRFSMRNPWGITECDGVLEIPNKREILNTIDFRLVMPGAAAPYRREDLGGYVVPAFVPKKADMYVSPEMLKLYNLDHYGPVDEGEYEE